MNLLPKIEKEIVKEGLKMRLTVAMLFLVSVSFLIGFILLLPSYFLSLGYFSKTPPEDSFLKNENEETVKKVLNMPGEIDARLKFFQSNINSVSAMSIFSKIIGYLPSGVTLNAVSFYRNHTFKDKNGLLVLVSGTSVDRNSLVSFSTLLKNSNSFSLVEVPVSSLKKDRNLPFSINIFIENSK